MGFISFLKELVGSNGSPAKSIKKFRRTVGDPAEYERWEEDDPTGLRSDHINTRNELIDFMATYQAHPWVYSSVNAIATAAASVKYQILDEHEEETKDNKICKILCQPNPHMVWYELMETTMSYLELAGNAFWEEVRDDKGNLIAIYPLRPDRMKIIPHPKVKISGYLYENMRGQEILFAKDDITHLKYFSSTDEYWGVSPVYAAQNSLILDFWSTAYNKKFFNNSAVPEGVLETEGSLSDAAWKRLGLEWKKRHKGLENAFEVAILEEGLKYKPIGFNQRDMQMMEMKKLSREEILAAFRVPPVMVGLLEFANYASSREQKKMFWMDNVLPKLDKMQQVINENLMPGKLTIKFVTDSIHSIIEDVQIATSVSMSLVTHGIMTINEVRKKYHGLGPVAWGKKWWAPVGLAPVDSGVHPTTPQPDMMGQPERMRTQTPEQAINQASPIPLKRRRKSDETIEFDKLVLPDPDWNDKKQVRYWKKWMVWKGLATPDYKELLATFKAAFSAMYDRVLPQIQAQYPKPEKKESQKSYIEKVMEEIYDEPYRIYKDTEFDPKIENMLFSIKEEAGKLRAKYIPKAKKILGKHGRFILGDIGVEIDFDFSNPRVEKFLEERGGINIEGITRSLRDQLGRELSKAVEAGEDFDDVKARIGDVFKGDLSESRARAIARTETITLTQFSRLEGAIQSGVVKKKRWVSELLNTTRESHRNAHDVEVDIDDKFDVESRTGIDKMFGPGDPTAQPENLVNCLCFLDFPGTTEEFEDLE